MFLRLFSRPAPPSAPPPPPVAERAEALLQRLEWTVIRRLDGWLQGDHRTLMRGHGLDLADLRAYQHHDDVRHIDWNVTARLQEPHVRVFAEDREMAAWLLLDLSPSVDFGSGERSKRDVVRAFAAVVARLIGRRGNRVGAVLWGAGHDQVLPARAGRTQVLRLLQAIGGAAAAGAPGRAPSATRLGDLLTMAQRSVRGRSTVLVVSDFISEPGWEKPLGELALRHDVVAVRVLDPMELALPNVGLVAVRDAESGEELWVDTNDAGFRQRFAAAAAQRELRLRESFARAGVDTLELATDGDLVDAVMRFVALRRRRGAGATDGRHGRWPAAPVATMRSGA